MYIHSRHSAGVGIFRQLNKDLFVPLYLQWNYMPVDDLWIYRELWG